SSNLYSTEYATYKDTVVEYDKELRPLYAAIGDATIVKHERDANDVVAVTYSNGTVVYVNYSQAAQNVGGTKVDALSYAYKAGEAKK
ncbi:MAG: hypothetical protein K6G62_08520, partial [Eubacterium sp.]|nr:hypothetical protein [Eubacterium sp.]